MKTAAASVMSASASAPPMRNRMRKTSAFLRKLSLKAEKNWVQNRGAKRRVINRDEDMALPPVPNGRATPTARQMLAQSRSLRPQAGRRHLPSEGADAVRLRNDNWGKRTIAQRGRGALVPLDKKMRAARGRPSLRSRHMRCGYRRRSCCPPRSIITAATPRQTAAPHASVNSEIHMASSPISPQSSVKPATNSGVANPFQEPCLGKVTEHHFG